MSFTKLQQSLGKSSLVPMFQLFHMQYVYCPLHETFEAVPAMPAELPSQISRALDSLRAIGQEGQATCMATGPM